MPSDRQIAANRNNAQKSTGPRSKAGREASRGNARRHGLAIDIGTDPAFSGIQHVGAGAREAAGAELDLLRIRKIRASLFETLYFVANAAAPDRLTERNDKLAKLERYERSAFSRRKRALRAML
jgi:hypothetical protein